MKQELNEICEILGLSENQRREFLNDLKNIENPLTIPFVNSSIYLKSMTAEIIARLISDPTNIKYVILHFSYPNGLLSIDKFKEITKLEYEIYQSENYN